MSVKKITLDNGIRILTYRMPHIRSASMGVWVNVGARDETEDQNGLSHFIEHMIFKGTTRRSAFQIAKEFDAIGGHTNAFTAMENTCYHARLMDTHLGTMVDILSDIFLNSVFDPLEIEHERPVIFQEIGMMEDSPEELIHLLSDRAHWGQNSLGRSILGTRENVKNFTSQNIKDYFHRFYQPDRIIISAAGSLKHDQFVDLIRPAFESLPPGKDLPERITPQAHSQIDMHDKDIEQVHICIVTKGLPVSDPRRYAFSLMNTILGGNMSSRLFQEIRERRGLAYSVYSFISPYIDTGAFGLYAGVERRNVNATIELIRVEIKKLKNQTVTLIELNNAKDYTIGNLMLASESSDNQMVRLAQNEIHFKKFLPLEEIVAHIMAITPDDIHALAIDLFQNPPITLTMLGPVKDLNPIAEDLYV